MAHYRSQLSPKKHKGGYTRNAGKRKSKGNLRRAATEAAAAEQEYERRVQSLEDEGLTRSDTYFAGDSLQPRVSIRYYTTR